MSREAEASQIIDEWFDSLRRYQNGLPGKGSAAAGLHVLERLKTDYNLDVSSHLAKGGAQIRGLSGAATSRLLASFDEHRTLSAVGGRSNRGTPKDVAALLKGLATADIDRLSEGERASLLTAMQRHLVSTHITKYFEARKVKAVFEPGSATSKTVANILADASDSGKAGAVAEHLVGAKLSLRFPSLEIRNKCVSVKDQQQNAAGDFEVGTTVFHVTMAPMPELFEKLRSDVDSGRRVYLLVPAVKVEGTRQNAETVAEHQVEVAAIESFVATNLDEMAEFDGDKLKSGIRLLLERYNERVDEVESDRSLLIEIPPNI